MVPSRTIGDATTPTTGPGNSSPSAASRIKPVGVGSETSVSSLNVSHERRRNRTQNKLSYKDQRELDSLPAEIEQLEADIAALQEKIAAPDFYTRDAALVQEKLQELSAAETLLEQRVERWGELETLQESFSK